MARRKQSLEELLAATAQEYEAEMAEAKEVLDHIHRYIGAMPEFALKNGMKIRVRPFGSLELTEDGELHCEFETLLGDKGHLDFMVSNTGSGRSFINEVTKGRGSLGGGRDAT